MFESQGQEEESKIVAGFNENYAFVIYYYGVELLVSVSLLFRSVIMDGIALARAPALAPALGCTPTNCFHSSDEFAKFIFYGKNCG